MSHTPTPEEREMLMQLARDCGVARDYRKECWIAMAAALTAEGVLTPAETAATADQFVKLFDQAFPS